MPNGDRGQIIGVAGLIALVASWAAIWVAPLVLSPQWVPRVWLMTIVVALCAVVAGVVAARMTSKWWYVLAGAGFLCAAFLLAGAAV